MAQDDRNERDRGSGREGGRETPWRGDDSFGGGWGNQTPRPLRLGDRNFRGEPDDPDYGAERYGPGAASGLGGEGYGGSDPESFFSAPGYDASFAGPRFDRADVGSTGTHGVHPVSSIFGGDYRGGVGITPGGGWGSSARRYAMIQRSERQQEPSPRAGQGPRSGFDPHYAEWRRRQIEQLDRDYEDYCREHQSRFEQEFGEWRERRGRQRQAIGRVAEHMEVLGSDGRHVGTVDAAREDRIVLTKSDASAGGHHHSIPCAWIDSVEDGGSAGAGIVRLNISAGEAMRRWRDVERSGALFDRGGRDGQESDVPDRSPSGSAGGRGEG